MNKLFKAFTKIITATAASVILIMGIKILTDGMYLLGLPNLSEIQSVSISCPAASEEIKELSDSENIELALQLTGFLKYDVLKKADNEEEALIFITYHLKNSTDKTVSASNTAVYWNGKCHALKERETFIKLTEAIFFTENLQTE